MSEDDEDPGTGSGPPVTGFDLRIMSRRRELWLVVAGPQIPQAVSYTHLTLPTTPYV